MVVVVYHRWFHPHLQLYSCGGGNNLEVGGSKGSGGSDGGDGGDGHHRDQYRDHHHPLRSHPHPYLCLKTQSRRILMMMIAHLLSAGHAVYDLSTIDNHHQSVNNDDDDHHSHSHDYSHHDHSSPWPGSDWTVEMVGRAKAGSIARQRSLCKCTCLCFVASQVL